MKVVYLCGPITGMTYEDATKGWRKEVGEALNWIAGVEAVSPMRGKHHLEGKTNLSPLGGPHLLSTPRAIITRDFFDVRRSALVFANFIGADRASIGSCVELGVAYERHIPIIACFEAGDIHDHAFIREIAWCVPTLEDGIMAATNLLTEGW